MKHTRIYYFSATGNSLEAARMISSGIKGSEIISMTEKFPKKAIGGNNEAIGFVFPVYFEGMPRIVRRFIEVLNIRTGTYCFAVATCGESYMNTLGSLDTLLKAKGLSLSYGTAVTMPGNYLTLYNPPSKVKVNEMLNKSRIALAKITEEISGNEIKPAKQRFVLLSKMLNRVIYTGVGKWEKNFRVTGKCTGCGLCLKVCPVGNIKIRNKRPVWGSECERCIACISWCPEGAVEFANKTKSRRRYTNPYVKVKDIICRK
ncbi:MAG: EFR1 family ferrodoxin [Spirochaetes bacterium]|nr:EFR1 family ferrodoxin [Spirochaetota bacterium]